MTDKIFIGKVTKKEMSGGNGPWEKISIALGPKDIEAIIKNRNDKGWINLLFKTSQKGGYYMEVDTYVPTEGGYPAQQQEERTPPDMGDLPF